MKILHTSDWHLGRTFGSTSLLADQSEFCHFLVQTASAERVELVVIAGDIFDRSIAPREAIELLRQTLSDLRRAGVIVAAITGNHDGPDRVVPYSALTDLSGVYLRGGYTGVGETITHEFSDGPLDLVLLPYLDPRAAPDDFGRALEEEESIDKLEQRRRRTHQSVLADAISAARTTCEAPRSLAISHAFVVGETSCEESESERILEVGGSGAVDASLFDDFSYTALGHLHKPQDVGRATLRYSGTPLRYSFSENHDKSVTLIEMDRHGASDVREIPLAIGRTVATLRGTIEELLEPLFAPHARDSFVRAVITNRETVIDLKVKLEQLYPNVVEIQLAPNGVDINDPVPVPLHEKVRTPREMANEFWEAVEGSPPTDRITSLLDDAVESALEVQP